MEFTLRKVAEKIEMKVLFFNIIQFNLGIFIFNAKRVSTANINMINSRKGSSRQLHIGSNFNNFRACERSLRMAPKLYLVLKILKPIFFFNN